MANDYTAEDIILRGIAMIDLRFDLTSEVLPIMRALVDALGWCPFDLSLFAAACEGGDYEGARKALGGGSDGKRD